jgi:hypothetical protein
VSQTGDLEVLVRADHPQPPGTWHRLSSWPVVGRRTVQRLVMRPWAAREPRSDTFNRHQRETRSVSPKTTVAGGNRAAPAEKEAHGGDDELTQRIKDD